MALGGRSNAKARLANAKTLLSAAASFAATAIVVRSVVQEFLPSHFQHYMFLGIKNYFNYFSSQLTMVINKMDDLDSNKIYDAAETYLASKISPTTKRLKVRMSEKEENITTTIENGEEVIDVFNGVELHWVFISNVVDTSDRNSSNRVMDQSFELSFHNKHREMVLNSYLPYIVKQAKELKQQNRTLKIFTVSDYDGIWYEDSWISTNLDHPTTFDKLAMDSETKDFILKDLERFVKRKEFYKNIGKAWKRGYLLYGPPGTGKSSLIAAIANYLKFNVYDLELTELKCNSDLRKLLMGMENRSILVVEDIDCTIEFKDRESEAEASQKTERSVTLSGLLNFIDGLWSSCGDERIIIFTTNHKEKLDPALLRPGRMDVHVHMSYCSPCGFRLLASNYLGIKEHKSFSEIEETILRAKVTPAMIAEEMLKGDDDPDNALNDLLEFLKARKIENEEADKAIIIKTDLEAKEKEENKQENATAAAA